MPLRIKIITSESVPWDHLELVDRQTGSRAITDLHTGEASAAEKRDLFQAGRLSATIIEELWRSRRP